MDNKQVNLNEWAAFMSEQFEGCQVIVRVLETALRELSQMRDFWRPCDKDGNVLPYKLTKEDVREIILLMTYGKSPSMVYEWVSDMVVYLANFSYNIEVEELTEVALLIIELKTLGRGR